MSKKLLEEGTIKRWKKLAGIREAKTPSNFDARLRAGHAAAGGKGETSGRSPEYVKAEQIERIRPKLKKTLAVLEANLEKDDKINDEEFKILLGMIHGNRSSYVRGLEDKDVPEVTIDEIMRRLVNIEYEINHASGSNEQTKFMNLYNKITRLKKAEEERKKAEEERKKALEQPLTPEEEAGLSDPSADLSLSSLSTDLRTIAGERDLPKQKRQDITTMPGPRGGFVNEGKQSKKKK